MKSSITKLLIFAAGAAIGSVVTWKLVKDKYKDIATEEIASVKEIYHAKIDLMEDELRQTKDEYSDIVSKEGYSTETEKEEGGDSMNSRIYIIPPEEFGQKDGYDAISLNYFADGVLTDDWNEPIEDVEGTVGEESLTHFGEYEDDSVFVRNDILQADYEILKDLKNFSDLADENESD